MTLRLAIAAAALFVAGAASPIHAQGAPADGRARAGAGMMGNQQRMSQMLFDGLTLTADQQARVKAVDEKFQPRMDAMRQEMRGAMQGGTPNPDARTKMTNLNNEYRGELRAILTADQQKKFDENVARMQQRGGRGGRPPTGIR